MGWGLYAGDDLYPHLRKTYYNRFGQLLFTQAQALFAISSTTFAGSSDFYR